MINEVSRHMHQLEVHDIRIVSQFRNIRWQGEGHKRRAIPIGMDDFHDSAAIAIVCRDAMPIVRGCVGTAGWDDTWGR